MQKGLYADFYKGDIKKIQVANKEIVSEFDGTSKKT
jgi:hypothetical protein